MSGPRTELTLEHVRVHGALIVKVVLAALVLGSLLGYSVGSYLMPEEFRASAVVEFTSPDLQFANQVDLETTRDGIEILLESREVRQRAAADLGLELVDFPTVTAEAGTRAVLVDVVAVSSDPAVAAAAVNATVDAAVALQSDRRAQRNNEILTSFQDRQDELATQIEDRNDAINAIEVELAALPAPSPPNQAVSDVVSQNLLDRLSLERALRDQLERQRLDLSSQTQQYFLTSLAPTDSVRSFKAAELPRSPSTPEPSDWAVLVGLAFAVAAGLVMFAWVYASDRVGRDVIEESRRAGTKAIGFVELAPGLAAFGSSPSAMAASIVVAKRSGEAAVMVGVGWPRARDGARRLVTALAHHITLLGELVVVVDTTAGEVPRGSLRSDVMASTDVVLFPLPVFPSGSDTQPRVLTDNAGSDDGLHRVRDASDRIASMRASADFVLVILPPLLESAEGVALAGSMDSVLLVGTSERTRRTDLHESVRLLDRVMQDGVGLVLVDPPNRTQRRRTAKPIPPASDDKARGKAESQSTEHENSAVTVQPRST